MTKDTDKVVKFWLMSSKDNFETASATLKAGRYNFAMFMCQQAVDGKILKIDAHYIKARYKEDRFNEKIYNKRNASSLLKDTEDVIRWYTKKLKLEI